MLVADVGVAANSYCDRPGFTHDRFWGEPPGFCILRRDGLRLMLSRVSKGREVVPRWKVVEEM